MAGGWGNLNNKKFVPFATYDESRQVKEDEIGYAWEQKEEEEEEEEIFKDVKIV
jgi:hypothetical protein